MTALPGTVRDAFRLFAISARDPLRFAVYACVNILAGSLGILMPIAAGLYASSQPATAALTRVLKDGNGYTFAVALLATSSAFLLNDLLDRDRGPTSYVALRLVAGLLGVLLLLTLALYSGMHFLAKVLEAVPATAAVGVAATVPSIRWTGQETWQTALVVATVFYGVWLFCLQHIDDHEEYGQTFRERRSELAAKAGAATSASGIQA